MKSLIHRVGTIAVFMSACASLHAQPAAGEPLSLSVAIQTALAHNRQVKVVRYSPRIAHAKLSAGRGVFDPSLTLGRDHHRDRTPSASTTTPDDWLSLSDSYKAVLAGHTPWGLEYSVGTWWSGERPHGNPAEYAVHSGVSLIQPLPSGRGRDAQLHEIRLLKADTKISEWEFRQAVIDTVTRVVVGYSDLQFAHEYLRVTQRSHQLAEGLLKENEIRVAAGGMSNNQLVQARARASARNEAVILADRALRDADLRLRHLLGESSGPGGDGLLTIQDGLPSTHLDVTGSDLEKAWVLRPDFQQARLHLGKRDTELAYARNALMPRLDLVGGYGFNGSSETLRESRRMAEGREFPSYSFGVVLTVPLTFARERGRLRAARLEREQAEEDLGRLKQEIALNVKIAAGRIESARQRIVATRAAYNLANQALEDEVKKLRAGTSTTFVVLSLQESLSNVEVAMHRAIAEERIATALYDREIGSTLERHSLNLAVVK